MRACVRVTSRYLWYQLTIFGLIYVQFELLEEDRLSLADVSTNARRHVYKHVCMHLLMCPRFPRS